MPPSENREPILVSACLLGFECRYDGKASYSQKISDFLKGRIPIPFCPELYGGLPTPREACEITSGTGNDVLLKRAQVLSASGIDLTENFITGSLAGLKICLLSGAQKAILKESSPSCGVRSIYSNNKPREGMGVFAALLKKNNIEIISSEDI